jgi:hypothetical protein
MLLFDSNPKMNHICKSLWNMGSFMLRVYLSFQPTVNPVNFFSQNRGNYMFRIQKIGANVQSLKMRGKRAVENENEGSYAIFPFSFSFFFCTFGFSQYYMKSILAP